MRARFLIFLLCISIAFPSCVTTDYIDDDGNRVRTYSIDKAAALDILLLAIQAFDLVTARIDLYRAQGDDISEPDAIQLLLAETREAFLRRGIDFLNRQFDELQPGQEKIRVPAGLMRRVEKGIEAETGISVMLLSSQTAPARFGVNFSFLTWPSEGDEVSPALEPWRFRAAGFAPLL